MNAKSEKPEKKSNAPQTAAGDASKGERIAKVLARAGVCSRRDAERLIAAGRVMVNGKVLDSPALNIGPKDKVLVDNQPLQATEPTRLWRLHKPRGQVTTSRDPEGRPTVFDALPKSLPRVISIGRLDVNTEGLLLLTNDGELARRLELPATGWARRYRVRAYGRTDQAKLDELQNGIKLDGVQYGPIQARLEREQASNVWITMTLREGKNREIKRVLEALNLTVNRLIRVSYGPFQLGDLPEGQVQEVPARILEDQMGATDRKKNREEASGAEPRREGRKAEGAADPDVATGRGPGKPRGGSRPAGKTSAKPSVKSGKPARDAKPARGKKSDSASDWSTEKPGGKSDDAPRKGGFKKSGPRKPDARKSGPKKESVGKDGPASNNSSRRPKDKRHADRRG